MQQYGLPKYERPVVHLVDRNDNVFTLVGATARALRRAGFRDKASEMTSRVTSASSYAEAQMIMQEYVDFA